MATVLIVEHNRDLADAMAELLRLFRYTVQVARDGSDALSESASSQPDAVILDLGLPKVDGLEVARRLRQTYGSKVRLIANTTRSDEETRRKVSEAGFDEMLIKPVSIFRIVHAIQRGGRRASV
ncbi:MAG: response regulator [Mycobacteriales bacterium]